MPAFQAAEKGVPFMPLRGLIGSDILAYRPDWKVIDNPFGNHDPIVLLPAIVPDVALFHAPMADRDGNVWIGRDRELAMMAHAAKKTVVTVEKIHDGNLFDDPVLAAGALGGFYLDAVAVEPNGAWPLGLADHYPPDTAHSPNMPASPRPPTASPPISTAMSMPSARLELALPRARFLRPLPPCGGGSGRGVSGKRSARSLPPSRRASLGDLPLKGGGDSWRQFRRAKSTSAPRSCSPMRSPG